MHKIFSVDDHIIEPANVWTDRVPTKYRDLAPHLMAHPHFAARDVLEGEPGEWPLMRSAVRWHHTGERAGSGLARRPGSTSTTTKS